jgi:hypothetical protein
MEIVIGDRNVKELIVLVVHLGSSTVQLPRSSVGLHITSLNSHFCFGDSGTTSWDMAKGA